MTEPTVFIVKVAVYTTRSPMICESVVLAAAPAAGETIIQSMAIESNGREVEGVELHGCLHTLAD